MLKVYVKELRSDTTIRDIGFALEPMRRVVEVTGVLQAPWNSDEVSDLMRGSGVLVPLGAVNRERDALWTKALAEALGGDTIRAEKVLAAFNRLADAAA